MPHKLLISSLQTVQGRPIFRYLIFPKHSPLKPVFKLGWSKIREDGLNWHVYKYDGKCPIDASDIFCRKWEGDIDEMTRSQVEKVVVGPGHAIMVYFLLAFGCSMALVFLFAEIIYSKSTCRTRGRKKTKHLRFYSYY